MTEQAAEKSLMKLPITFDWVDYKGDTVFMGVNFSATIKAGKPMIDIFYCATEACNFNPLYTVQWDKSKFKRSRLSKTWE